MSSPFIGPAKKFLTIDEAAKMWSEKLWEISPRIMRAWVAEGVVPSVRIGRARRRVPRAPFEAIIEKTSQQATVTA